MEQLADNKKLRNILQHSQTIAVVGLSPKENRPSNMVARYMRDKGYTIVPVNPGQSEILGEVCYPDLASIPFSVDLVNIFRRSDEVLPVVEAAVTKGAKYVWMQQGIKNEDAEKLAIDSGLEVVMDRCVKIDHQALF